MSYLNLPNGIPNFSKAVISFWFRVPTESLQKVKTNYDELRAAEGNNRHPVFPRLLGVVPLMTFGPLLEGYQLDELFSGEDASYNINTWYTPGESWQLLGVEPHTYSSHSFFVRVAPFHVNPSYIGVIYNSNTEDFELHVHLQSNSKGPAWGVQGTRRNSINDKNIGYATGSAYSTFLETHWDFGLDRYRADDVAPGNPHVTTQTTVDESDEWLQQQGPDSFDIGFGITVAPDTWHHVLISFDLSKTTTTTGFTSDGLGGDYTGSRGTVTLTAKASVSNPCQAWVAMDDKNVTDEGINSGVADLLPNDIISRYNHAAYATDNGSNRSRGWDVYGCVDESAFINIGQPSATYSDEGLPAVPLGMPAASNMEDNIYRIEMAEFQMWTGVILDTGIENNRRAFVDKDGKPVDPTGTEDDPRGPGEKLLGKKPDVLLHGTSNWKEGYNTGTTGIRIENIDGIDTVVKIPKGQFKPTGGIEQYKPDPALEESTA